MLQNNQLWRCFCQLNAMYQAAQCVGECVTQQQQQDPAVYSDCAVSLTRTMNNFKQSVPFIACNILFIIIKGRIGIFIAGMVEL